MLLTAAGCSSDEEPRVPARSLESVAPTVPLAQARRNDHQHAHGVDKNRLKCHPRNTKTGKNDDVLTSVADLHMARGMNYHEAMLGDEHGTVDGGYAPRRSAK